MTRFLNKNDIIIFTMFSLFSKKDIHQTNLEKILLNSSNLFKKIKKFQKTQKIDLEDVKIIIKEVYFIINEFEKLKLDILNDTQLKDKQKKELLSIIEKQKYPLIDLEIKIKKYEDQIKEIENISDIKKNPLEIKGEVKEKKLKKNEKSN